MHRGPPAVRSRRTICAWACQPRKSFPVRYAASHIPLAKEVVESATHELESLNTHRFASLVGRGHNFLLRAQPVFDAAESVYAVSIDRVSRFWVSPDRSDQRTARNYWKAQPMRTHRLFVFASPESAHNYSTIMNIHARRYGRSGGVYLCSSSTYERLLASTGIDVGQSDFAALEYASPRGPVTYVATLDEERFVVNKEPTQALEQHMDAFKKTLKRLSGMAPGMIEADSCIMRWQVDMQADPHLWASKLSELFGERAPDVFHMVFVSSNALNRPETRERLQSIVRELRNALTDLQDARPQKIHVKDFWVGEAHPSIARDGLTDGRICNDGAQLFPLLLLMRFEAAADLQHWYSERTHSALRRRIYELLDARIPGMFVQALESPEMAARAYEQIEQIACADLVRRDYLEADTIDDIVRRRPFRPPISFE